MLINIFHIFSIPVLYLVVFALFFHFMKLQYQYLSSMQGKKDLNYRIKPLNKKTEELEDQLKLQVHSGTNFNKSHSVSKRQTQSNLDYSRKRDLLLRKTMSKIKQRLRPQSSKKKPQQRQVMQFDNVKWISIISAYDPNRLKFVTTTNQSCQKFLKTHGPTMKNDVMGGISFRDLIKNFKSWIGKIDQKYFYIMDSFLNNKKGVNSTLQKLKPMIDQVLGQTEMMQQKIEHCLKTYQNFQFRKLLQKFHNYLEASKQIEQIIIIVSKSKQKIEELFRNFQKDKKLDQHVNKVRVKGINEARQVVLGHNQTGLQGKIMEKVQSAINQMAQKSLEAFSKIKGVKQLMQRLKKVIDQNKNYTDLKHIIIMNEIFKEVFNEALSFDKFIQKFLQEDQVVNNDLRSVIKRYQEQVNSKKKVVNQLQLNFLHHILNQIINKLRANSKITQVLHDPNHHEQYVQTNKLIAQISQCFLDQEKRFLLQKIGKDTKYNLIRLDDELQKLRKITALEDIDSQQGLITILQIDKLMKEYKDRIRSIRKKYEECHKNLHLGALKIEAIGQDEELAFMSQLNQVSQKINGHDLKERIQSETCFSSPFKYGLAQLSIQSQKNQIIIEIKDLTYKITKLQKSNIFQKYFGPINITHQVLTEAVQMQKMKKVADQTRQKNLIPQLNTLIQQRKNWIQQNNKCSRHFEHYYERLLAKLLVKSLKEADIKEIDKKSKMIFPANNQQVQAFNNQMKYKRVICEEIQKSFATHGKLINSGQHQHHSEHRGKKSHCHVANLLNNNIKNMEKFVWAYQTINSIQKNQNNSVLIAKQEIIDFCQNLFHLTFIANPNNYKDSKKITNLVQNFLKVSNDKILNLSRKIFQFESLQKNSKFDQSVNIASPQQHILKITQAIQKYRKLIQNMVKKCKQIFEEFLSVTKKNKKGSQDKSQIQYFSLKIYSTFILYLAQYLKQTKQIVYVLLNNQKSPFVILNIKDASKTQYFKVLVKGLKKGEKIKQCIWRPASIGIELSKQAKNHQSQQNTFDKAVKSKKKKPQLSEQIQQMPENYDQNFQMEEDIGKNEVQDEMIEDQMEEIQDIQMEENMDQQDLKQDINSNIEQIDDNVEIQQEKIEDLQEMLEDYDQEISKSHANNKKKSNKANKSKQKIDEFQQWGMQQKINNEKKKQEDQKKIQQQKKKQEQKIKKQEEERQKAQKIKEARKKIQYVTLSKAGFPTSIDSTIYECVSAVTTLFQLKNILNHIFSFGLAFFTQINFKNVADFFNKLENQTATSYIKNLDGLIDKQVQKIFVKQIRKQILNLHSIKQLKRNILMLQNGNFKELQQNLQKYLISYNIIKNKQKQSIFIHINQENNKTQNSKCLNLESIDGILSQKFKNYSSQTFNLIEYVSNCFQMNKVAYKSSEKGQNLTGVIQYTVIDDTSLPNETTDEIYKSTINTIQNFNSGSSKDHINKFDLCINLWLKALHCIDKIALDLSEFDHSNKSLKQGNSQTSVLYYVNNINQKCKQSKKTIKKIKNKLQNIAFKCTQDTILECIKQIKSLYGNAICKTVSHDNRELIIFDESFYQSSNQIIQDNFKRLNQTKEITDRDIIISLLFSQASVNHKQNEVVQSQPLILKCKKFNDSKFIQQEQNQTKRETIKKQTAFLSILSIKHYFIYSPIFIIQPTFQECVLQFTNQNQIAFKHEISKNLSYNNRDFLIKLYQKKGFSQLNKQYLNLFKQIKSESERQSLKLSTQIIIDGKVFELKNTVSQFKIFIQLQQKYQLLINGMKKMFSQKQNNLCFFIYNNKNKQIFGQLLYYILKTNQEMAKLYQLSKQCNQNISWFMFFDVSKFQKVKSYEKITQVYLNKIQKLSVINQALNFQIISEQIQNSYEFIKKLFQNENIDLAKCEIQTDQNIHVLYFQLNTKNIKLQQIVEMIYPNNELSVSFLSKLMSQSLIQVQGEQQESSSQGLKEFTSSLDWTSLINQIKQHIQEQGLDQICLKIQQQVRVYIKQFNLIYFSVNSRSDSVDQEVLNKLYQSEDKVKKLFSQINKIQRLKTISNQFNFIKQNKKILSIFKMLQDSVKNNCFTEVVIENILKIFKKLNIKQIKPNQFNYKLFSQFFMYTVQKVLKLSFYTVLSSNKKILTFILPQKQEQTQIDQNQTLKGLTSTMKSLNLPLNFQVKKANEVKIIQLKSELIEVSLDSSIIDQQTIQFLYDNNFGLQGEYAAQKWYFAIYQNYQNKMNLLAVYDLSLYQQEVNILLDFSHLKASISCFIVQMNPSNKLQTDMRKKAQKLSGKSPQQKIMNVRVGEKIKFKQASQWLMSSKQKVKKHIEQKSKEEQQLIKKYLGKIYKQMEVVNLQSFQIPFAQLQQQMVKDKNDNDNYNDNENQLQKLQPRSKKVIEQAKKVFKRVSLTNSVQQNKLGQQILDSYVNKMNQKIAKRQKLQNEIVQEVGKTYQKMEKIIKQKHSLPQINQQNLQNIAQSQKQIVNPVFKIQEGQKDQLMQFLTKSDQDLSEGQYFSQMKEMVFESIASHGSQSSVSIQSASSKIRCEYQKQIKSLQKCFEIEKRLIRKYKIILLKKLLSLKEDEMKTIFWKYQEVFAYKN